MLRWRSAMWPPSPRQAAVALKPGRVDWVGTRKLAPKLRKAAHCCAEDTYFVASKIRFRGCGIVSSAIVVLDIWYCGCEESA